MSLRSSPPTAIAKRPSALKAGWMVLLSLVVMATAADQPAPVLLGPAGQKIVSIVKLQSPLNPALFSITVDCRELAMQVPIVTAHLRQKKGDQQLVQIPLPGFPTMPTSEIMGYSILLADDRIDDTSFTLSVPPYKETNYVVHLRDWIQPGK